ncbi:hypothetical protein B0H13DRAFT_2416493 [Mycena leptocephala]|nr:hypothetical protein B0H13DRAFT_2416493 [Mycena leptocephala]
MEEFEMREQLKVLCTCCLLGAFVVLVFLTTINVVLTGYETITVFQSDYNVTQSHWYHQYIPSLMPKPGTLCDSRVFNLGDTFTTNILCSRDSGISYKGWTLENCDMTSLYLHGDANSYTIEYTAIVECRSDDYSFSARTDFSLSSLAGKYNSCWADSRSLVLDAVTSISSTDAASRTFTFLQATNGTSPVIVSLQADFPFCPAALGRQAACAVNVPQFNISSSFVSYANLTFHQYFASDPLTDSNQPVITNDTYNVLSNVIQTMYAAVRIDLGNPSPNNFLLNTSVIPATIFSTFPATLPGVDNTSEEYANLVGTTVNPDFNITGLLPLTVEGPALMDVVYLCRFQHPLPPAQAFIAVLVATLSMFSSGWAIFLALATKVVKRRNSGANSCSQHATELTAGEKKPFLD